MEKHIECKVGDVLKIKDCIGTHSPDYVCVTDIDHLKDLDHDGQCINGQELSSIVSMEIVPKYKHSSIKKEIY